MPFLGREPELSGWPVERARLQLAFGEWLRRQRRVVESRTHLRAARETFDALGVLAWGERARRELRGATERRFHAHDHGLGCP